MRLNLHAMQAFLTEDRVITIMVAEDAVICNSSSETRYVALHTILMLAECLGPVSHVTKASVSSVQLRFSPCKEGNANNMSPRRRILGGM